MRSKGNVFDVWDDLFSDFQSIFDQLNEASEWIPAESVLARAGELVDSGFPPCNMKVDKDKNLLIEFAVAGYEENEIKLTYEKNHLVVTIEPKKEEDDKTYRVIRHGIKRGKVITRVYVPSSLYDSQSIKAKFKNGVLSVNISSLPEVKPASISIST